MGSTELKAEDLLAQQHHGGNRDDRGKQGEAEEFLLRCLADGPQPSLQLFKEARENLSISKSTLRRAKDELGVIADQEGGFGSRWVWYLPTRLLDAQSTGMSTLSKESPENVEQTPLLLDAQPRGTQPPDEHLDEPLSACPACDTAIPQARVPQFCLVCGWQQEDKTSWP